MGSKERSATYDDLVRLPQAMIKFSHAELDRRMSTLEDNQRNLAEVVTDLRARVERLESSRIECLRLSRASNFEAVFLVLANRRLARAPARPNAFASNALSLFTG